MPPAVLYYVKSGDTMFNIAKKFGTTVDKILKANILCNPNLIYPWDALIIPISNEDILPRAGGFPYYIVRPGDSLFCIAKEFGTTIDVLVQNNKISNPNLIFPGQELLVIGERPDAAYLKNQWENLGGWTCDIIPPISMYGIYYRGTFAWEALGEEAIQYLLPLLEHPCYIVRLYTVIALGRVAKDGKVETQLKKLSNDPELSVRQLVPLALRRIALNKQGIRKVHLIISPTYLYQEPNMESSHITLNYGTEVVALRWNIPSPTAEEGPRGGIQMYDRVVVRGTNKVGFIPRGGFDEIAVI